MSGSQKTENGNVEKVFSQKLMLFSRIRVSLVSVSDFDFKAVLKNPLK
jgi:hypothetical protein